VVAVLGIDETSFSCGRACGKMMVLHGGIPLCSIAIQARFSSGTYIRYQWRPGYHGILICTVTAFR